MNVRTYRVNCIRASTMFLPDFALVSMKMAENSCEASRVIKSEYQWLNTDVETCLPKSYSMGWSFFKTYPSQAFTVVCPNYRLALKKGCFTYVSFISAQYDRYAFLGYFLKMTPNHNVVGGKWITNHPNGRKKPSNVFSIDSRRWQISIGVCEEKSVHWCNHTTASRHRLDENMIWLHSEI